MPMSISWSGLDQLQQTVNDLKDSLASSIQDGLGTVLETIQKEAYGLTPYDPDNPHTGTEDLRILTPRKHKGTSIPPADIHLKRGQNEDTGHLRDTAVVDTLYDDAIHVVAGQISYNSPYAVYQHEDLTLNHPNGGQGKYLESPWLDHQADILEEIGQAVVDAQSSGAQPSDYTD